MCWCIWCVDEVQEGNQYHLFKEIMNHRKNKSAMDKADQYRVDSKSGKKTEKKTTAGWDFEVK